MIYEYLKERGAYGKDNAALSLEICAAFEELTPRRLQKQIYTERREGRIICSRTDEGGGYYLPAAEEDVLAFVKQQEGRIKSHAVAVRAARRWLKEHKAAALHETGKGR